MIYRVGAIALLVMSLAVAVARAADPVAPSCKNGAPTCLPWERDWSSTALPPGSVVTAQGVIYAPPANPLVNFLYNWQTLITGLIALIIGVVTVATLRKQIADLQAARKEDEQHAREIERAYVAGGGCRDVARRLYGPDGMFLEDEYRQSINIVEQADGSTILLVPTDQFQLHIVNHGKTPARLHHVAIGFCDAAALPLEPVYEFGFPWSDAIGPGLQTARIIKNVDIPEGRHARIAICGRYYWDDIWGRHWSSGFVYEIPSKEARSTGSISVEASAKYWDDREEEPPGVEGG